MLCLLIILSLSMFAWGQDYSTYTVTNGDTLWAIATRYDTTINELQQVNGLQSATINVGQQLYLPTSVGGSISAESAQILSGYPNSFKVHSVTQNESLSSIAQKYNLNEDTLQSANPELMGPPIQGTVLRIPPNTGRVLTLQTGESLISLSLKYNLAPSELAKSNGVERLNLLKGQKVFVPIMASVAPQTSSDISGQSRRNTLYTQQLELLRKAPTLLDNHNHGHTNANQNYAWPLSSSGRLTSNFGYRDLVVNGSNFHAGIDLAANIGTPILAAKDGIVTKSGWLGGYGYAVYINHNDGTQTRYAHMSQILVGQNQYVKQGEMLGLVGSTGISTGPHLHFELRVNGYAVNPLEYLDN